MFEVLQVTGVTHYHSGVGITLFPKQQALSVSHNILGDDQLQQAKHTYRSLTTAQNQSQNENDYGLAFCVSTSVSYGLCTFMHYLKITQKRKEDQKGDGHLLFLERRKICRHFVSPLSSVSVSAQGGIVALGKGHTHSGPSLSSLSKVALETVPIFAWLNTDRSRPWGVECRPLPFSTPLSFRRSVL